jgi:hypothetical protein
MASIDIQVEPDLQALFALPSCADIQIPGPSPLTIHLPGGGTLQAFSDLSKGIPTDCAMTFSLMLQLSPFLAATECLFKVLGLLKPLVDIITGLPAPPSPKLILDFGKAVAALTPCFLSITPLAIIPFIKDLLCLILKALKCFLSQMKTLLAVMGGLSLQLNLAQAAGNTDLVNSIQCAQANSQAQAAHMMASMAPIGLILDLAGDLFGIAGIAPIKLPALGSSTDLAALNTVVETMQSVVATIQIAADALGGCD